MGRKLVMLWVLPAVVLLGMALPACSRPKQGPPASEIPSQQVQTAFLQQHGLMGKVVLIQFGIPTCAVSDQYLDEMIRLHKGNRIPGLTYVRVEMSKDKKEADEYYLRKAPPFLVYRDPDGMLAKAFDQTVLGHFVLVDKFAHVRYRGKFPLDDLADWTATLAAETADPGPAAVVFGGVKLDPATLLATTRLPDLTGKTGTLADRMGEGGLLLVFVDTTCPFSGTAIGEMPAVAKTLAQHKVPSVLVNIDQPKDGVAAFYQKRDPGAPVVYDATTTTRLQWNVTSVPTVVYLSPAKQIAYSGNAVWKDLAAAVEKARNLPAGTLKFAAGGTEYG